MSAPEHERIMMRKICEMPFEQRKHLEREWSQLKKPPALLAALKNYNAAVKS